MKFVDEAKILVKAGDGGQGCTSFRREKFVPKGGPDGGDGGKGGDVVISGSQNLASLLDFKYRRIFKAEKGKNGSSRNKRGRDGKNLIIHVPFGTVVFEGSSNKLLVDITANQSTCIVARGGKGGKGNAHFVTPTHRVPYEFEPGEPGEEKELLLVLKLIADVGIIGLPNAGKSTLISRLTDATPKIGDYPFTTLSPILGVLREGDNAFVIADIPGIIEGASQGRGLGLTFLRHIERTRILLLVLDVSATNPVEDYNTLRHELNSYKRGMFSRQRIVILNKADKVSEEKADKWRSALIRKKEEVVVMSALKGWGIDALKEMIKMKDFNKVAHA